MSPNARLLLYALAAVVALIVLIARFKLHPFVVLIAVSLGLGIAAGMPLGGVVKSFQDGVGNVLGFIAIVVGLGTMLGKMMAESGGATRIATTLIGLWGEQRVHWAIMCVAFIVGLPVFFQVGFVLLVPLVFTIARRTGMSLVKIGIPLVAGLSVVHGMVPPHPAAMLAVGAYQADIGRTILFASRGLGIGRIGLLAALYPAVWGAGQLVTGGLSDRWGRKRLIVAGMWLQAGAITIVAISSTFGPWAVGAVLLGAGTAMVYPTLLAAIGDVAHPAWRASAVGVYRLWRDAGFAVGALVAGATADALGLRAAIWVVAVLTAASGIVVAVRMYETHPRATGLLTCD